MSSAVMMAALTAACGGAEHAPGHDDSAAGGEAAAVLGSPASAESADRRIKVETLDELAFDPPEIEVAGGETVTFVVTNTGQTAHEFVLGNQAYQEQHAKEMNHGEHGSGVVEVEPGETKELTWSFDEQGSLLAGCHEPGHYEGGMVASIEVT